MASHDTSSTHEEYYVPAQSKWPIVGSIGLLVSVFGAGTLMNSSGESGLLILLAGALIITWMFFGALFYVRTFAGPWLSGDGDKGISNMLWEGFQYSWPLMNNPDPNLFPGPQEIISPWQLPLINTILLITSSVTVTFAHHALRAGKRGALKNWLLLTVVLAVVFLSLQIAEYVHAYKDLGLTLNSGIYGATFFMLTGFHGAHVFMGTLILTVMLVRVHKGHFTPENHFGFEAASWYWHFVDVVWVGLFIFVYIF